MYISFGISSTVFKRDIHKVTNLDKDTTCPSIRYEMCSTFEKKSEKVKKLIQT